MRKWIIVSLIVGLTALISLLIWKWNRPKEGMVWLSHIALPRIRSVGCQDYFWPRYDVAIDKNGSLLIGKKHFTSEAFDSFIASRSNDFTQSYFLLWVDTNAPFANIWSNITTWRRHGGQMVSFVVTDGGRGFGAIDCWLPISKDNSTGKETIILQNDTNTMIIGVYKDCFIIEHKNIDTDGLKSSLEKTAGVATEMENTSKIAIVPMKDATFAKFMEVLILCRDLGLRRNLYLMEEQNESQVPSANRG